jgi:hypothetical protein
LHDVELVKNLGAAVWEKVERLLQSCRLWRELQEPVLQKHKGTAKTFDALAVRA